MLKSETQIEFEKQLFYITDTALTCVHFVRLIKEYQELKQQENLLVINYNISLTATRKPPPVQEARKNIC